MTRKIYISDDLYFDESLELFIDKGEITWDFIGYRQKALRVLVKASADGRSVSKEELFARVYDNEYDTFYNEERDGSRIKQLVRSVRRLLAKYDIELPRVKKEGYGIPICKVEAASVGNEKWKEMIQNDEKKPCTPIKFESSMYLEAAEMAVRDKEKYWAKEKRRLAGMRDGFGDTVIPLSIDKGIWFWTYRDMKAAYYYDLFLFAEGKNIQKAEDMLKNSKTDSDIEQAISEELLAACMELTTKDSDDKRTEKIIALTEDAIKKYEKIAENYSNYLPPDKMGMLFQPHSNEEIMATIAWLKDNLGTFLARTNQKLDFAERLLKDALYYRKKETLGLWPIENNPAIAWSCMNIAKLLCNIPGRKKEALHYCRMAMWLGDEFKRDRFNNYSFIRDMASDLFDKINEEQE